MTIEDDGSITFMFGEKLPILSNHRIDPNNNLRLIPKFEPCRYRVFKRRSPCGKRPLVHWWCLLFKMQVSAKHCSDCKVTTKESLSAVIFEDSKGSIISIIEKKNG